MHEQIAEATEGAAASSEEQRKSSVADDLLGPIFSCVINESSIQFKLVWLVLIE
jgi:hypothetical protein